MKKLKKFILFLILIFAISSIAYFMYANFFDKKAVAIDTTEVDLNPDNWAVYSNDTWGYSFKYPDTLFINCNTHNTDKVASFYNKNTYKSCPTELTDKTISHFNIIITDLYDQTTLPDLDVIEVNQIIIGDKIVNVSRYQVAENQPAWGENDFYFAEIPLDDNKLSIAWLSSDKDLFIKILSGFSFNPN